MTKNNFEFRSIRRVGTIIIFITGLAAVLTSIGVQILGLGDQAHFGVKQTLLLLVGLIFIAGSFLLYQLPVVKSAWSKFRIAIYKDEIPLTTKIDRLSFLLLISVWFGIAIGFGEVVIQSIQKLNGKRIFLGLNFIWMTPVVEVCLFFVIGLLLFLISLRASKYRFLQVGYILYFSVGFFSWLSLFPGIYRAAIWVLAIGLGIQAGRMALKRSAPFYWFLRRTVIFPLFILFISILSLIGWHQYTTQKAISALPTPIKNYPNIIFIVLDTVRSQNMSLYGYDRSTTPFLERFAQQSVLFENAFSPSSWTFPSHASMFTGRYPHELNNSWVNPLSDQYPTLAGYLSDIGYLTMGFSANVNHVSWEERLDRGFVKFEGYPITASQFVISSSMLRRVVCYLGHGETCDLYKWLGVEPAVGRKNAVRLNKEVLSYLSGIDRSRPFFLFMNYFDAHEPHIAPSTDIALGYRGSSGQGIPFKVGLSREERMNEYIDGYDAQIYYLDNHLEALFNELTSRGLIENSIVIITSDHGQEFLEHGEYGHGSNLYATTIRVPLLISFPGTIRSGIKIDQVVSTKDIPATITDLIGSADSSPFPGISLRNLWDESLQVDYLAKNYPVSETSFDANWDDVGTMVSVIDGKNHYIQNVDGEEELFSLTDIWETENLLDRMEEIPNIDTFRNWVIKIFRN